MPAGRLFAFPGNNPFTSIPADRLRRASLLLTLAGPENQDGTPQISPEKTHHAKRKTGTPSPGKTDLLPLQADACSGDMIKAETEQRQH